MNLFWINNKNQSFDFFSSCEVYYIDGADFSMQINSLSSSGYNGATFISSQMNKRTLKIFLKLKNNSASEREKLIVSLSGCGTLFFDDKKIDGVVSSVKYTISSEKTTDICVEIICLDPFFKGLDLIEKNMSAFSPEFTFPFTFDGNFSFSTRSESIVENFYSSASFDVFPIIEFTALSTLDSPYLMNVNTYEKMKVNTVLNVGEKLIIDTRIGKKSIKKGNSGNFVDCFNSIAPDFKFFPLYPGDNFLKYAADSNCEGLCVCLRWENIYPAI